MWDKPQTQLYKKTVWKELGTWPKDDSMVTYKGDYIHITDDSMTSPAGVIRLLNGVHSCES